MNCLDRQSARDAHDVAALEGYLRDSAIRVRVAVPMGRGRLCWALAEPPRRWRIVYEIGRRRTALAAAKREVRLAARHRLPDLLSAVAAEAQLVLSAMEET